MTVAPHPNTCKCIQVQYETKWPHNILSPFICLICSYSSVLTNSRFYSQSQTKNADHRLLPFAKLFQGKTMFCGTGAACNMPQQTNIVVGGILSCCHYHSKRGRGSHSRGIACVPVTLGPAAATTKSASQYFKSTLQDVPKWVAAHKISAHNTYKGVIKAGERNVKSCTIFMLASLHKPVVYLCLYWKYVWCRFRFLHFPQRL